MRLRILSLTTVFPNPLDPRSGLFVRSRLQHLADYCDVRVVCPVPAADWAVLRNKKIAARRADPGWTTDGRLEVTYPRWFYPPGGGALNGYLLAEQIAGRIRRLRSSFRFDIIDAHFGHPEGVAAARLAQKLNCPFVVTLRGHEPVHSRHAWRRRAMSWSLCQAGRVIAVSGRLASFAASQGVMPERIRTIGNGVNSEVFRALDRSECRRKHGVEDGVRVLLSVGHLVEGKGHHRVISALPKLPKDVRLWIAGETGRGASFESRLKGLANQPEIAGAVRFLGGVSPVVLAELMNAADLLCLASDREGWPNVVHEALSCGTPVVATDVGAVPDLIPGEEFGIVVEPADDVALEKAMSAALAREWDRDAIAAWGQSRSWRRVGAEVFAELEAVIGEWDSRSLGAGSP